MPMDRKTRTSSFENKKKRMFHTTVTASEGVYSLWQCRIMYYWFKKFKNGPNSEMVLHRPWAFVQWLELANIEEDYILMAEPDHIIMKPIPNLSQNGLPAAFPFSYIESKKEEAILRKFFPEEKGPITNIAYVPCVLNLIAYANVAFLYFCCQVCFSMKLCETGLGNLYKIAPTWMNVSLAMKRDPEADLSFEWVLEM
ncbi:hydroxyproline O-arabinosyltransferase 1-like [Heracleum sosnowskyi]|uniref:Hydroxyproline O-arabinosyltransferase 1-like n=1 Tax=Heracleum sosnowskyi TaxID=360622 RepID=A0AAD8MDU7_9APIA|nr:hydroxyproline O-arabinosyltransferase 1-like [Heracleum sosnowskyi]